MAEKMQMPSGMGGLVRYFDDYKSKIEFKPIIVIVMIIVAIILEIILHRMGNGWFGLQ
ncbi:MAG: preprotein translocase subunit Sec61beta [Nanoarchaeota archaeon]|nr:preprotein translocase subunit Sec61beta [Nanoarchaeota archaeon]MBU1445202.1 preprotein translocase subunit Sec61beta [Nanoarchaeota archaeon]MBU2406758.1 preprotein translocase subunit Sec61beta [Nanoarchaeota archaeon]MBU2420286.1 preprotein translocase subunit Sec61beta [Nanoarchaeota archaeon]MBU2475318.1 preprotein translocase subunit Sec61beta [Nanoarchaeota archaeon]